MPKTLISQFPTETKFIPPGKGDEYLKISEMFCDTLQGEGIYTGVPATFIRLQGCTLNCVWCDTLEVWKAGNPYSFEEIFKLLEDVPGLINRFKEGQHLILTGGSPMLQQQQLVNFILEFRERYHFLPFIEIENEVMLLDNSGLSEFVNCWNNSPKLENSGMRESIRIKPRVIKEASSFNNSWFKFVVSDKKDWVEIETNFLQSNLIRKDQVILMPAGENQQQLSTNREMVARMAIENGVRFSDRMHVTIWDKKTGV